MKKIVILFLILYTNNILPSTNNPQQKPQSGSQPQQPIVVRNPPCPTVHRESFVTSPQPTHLLFANRSFSPAPPLPERMGKPISHAEPKPWDFQFTTEDFPDPAYTGSHPVTFSNPKDLFFLIRDLIALKPTYPRIQINSVKLPYLQQLIIQVCMKKNPNDGAIRYTQNCTSKITVKYHKNHPEACIPENLSLFDIFSASKPSKTNDFNNQTSAHISLILATNPDLAESELLAQIFNVLASGQFIREK